MARTLLQSFLPIASAHDFFFIRSVHFRLDVTAVLHHVPCASDIKIRNCISTFRIELITSMISQLCGAFLTHSMRSLEKSKLPW